MGFETSQFPVYLRFCVPHPQIETVAKRVEAALPAGRKVNVLTLTDQRAERTFTFAGRRRVATRSVPDHLGLL